MDLLQPPSVKFLFVAPARTTVTALFSLILCYYHAIRYSLRGRFNLMRLI